MKLPDGGCIIDIGANIGMFSVFASLHSNGAKIYSLEPLPPIFELLQLNTSLYTGDFKIFNIGISDRDELAEFSYFPNATVLSSRYAEGDDIPNIVRTTITNIEGESDDSLTDTELSQLLEDRLVTRKFECRLMTLSGFIRENNIGQVDYLKIDVEKSELDVLRGIEKDDWRKIKQIAIEVHDIGNRLEEIKEMLSGNGFSVYVDQGTYLGNTHLFDLYAISEDGPADGPQDAAFGAERERSWYSVHDLRDSIREAMKKELPSYMVPTYFIEVEKIPLTENGKVDRRALLQISRPDREGDIPFVAPRSDIERKLASIWMELLGKDKVSVKDSFFESGGHSLKAIRLVSRISKEFDVDYRLEKLFSRPTIEEIASEIKNSEWAGADIIEDVDSNNIERHLI
jgi:FkbM family methyltransferase